MKTVIWGLLDTAERSEDTRACLFTTLIRQILTAPTLFTAATARTMTGNHLHKVPVSDRPPPGIRDYLHFTTFNAFFALAMMAGHVSQLFCLPLAVLAGTESLFQTMMDWHKAVSARHEEVLTDLAENCQIRLFFLTPVNSPVNESLSFQLAARLLVLVSSIWAPTVLRITVDSNDKHLDLREIIQRDAAGAATGIALPERMVLMANHQVRNGLFEPTWEPH